MDSPSQIVKPGALRPGDSVAIVAPASPIERDLLRIGCKALRSMGYVPVYNDCILQHEMYFAGPAERRARDLEEMFVREDVKAIICARGGYGCNYLLRYLDLDVVRRHPKIFVGYSDVTTLLTWFHDKTGLVTFHGPMLTKDFATAHGVDLPCWHARVSGQVELQSASVLQPVAPGRAQGKLYGGCLSMLVASLGTPYEIQTKDVILFMEDIAIRPYQLDRMLMQLKLAGKLDSVRGLVFGMLKDCVPPPHSGYSLVDVIRRVVDDLGVPVAIGLNSGHVERGNLTLSLGTQSSLVVERDFAAIGSLEPAVAATAER